MVYFLQCRICHVQNVGSTIRVYRGRFNNYKSVHRKFRENFFDKNIGSKVKQTKICQEKFHKYFCGEGHSGIEDWEVILIDSAETEKELRTKELFWQYKLKTFHPNGLNEIEALVNVC